MEVVTMDTEESVSRDRLSELPNSLIHLILSLLPMRDAVSTTLLSKRWNNLWTTLPCLNFCEFFEDGAVERLRNFVNRAMILWNGTHLLKFQISICNLVDSSLAGDIDLWVRFAVKNKVQDLKINLRYDLDDDDVMENAYWVPQCLNLCSSLTKLSVEGCNFRIHGSHPPPWNQLKSLKIDSYRMSECLINQLLLGSPRLEVFELRFMESHDNLNIMSTSLKKLKIQRYLYNYWGDSSLDTVFRIWCPNLEIFEFDGGPYGKCLFTDVSSLIDATLHFRDEICYNYDDLLCLIEFGKSMRQVFSTHVEKVALSDWAVRWCVQVLDASQKKYLHSPNVKVLKLGLADFNDLVEVMDLLRIFPNLKMLAIEFRAIMKPSHAMQFEANLPKSFLQLKIVEITARLSDFTLFEFIEFLLNHAISLEKLVLRSTGLASYRRSTLIQISEKLLSMLRSSPAAKVILI